MRPSELIDLQVISAHVDAMQLLATLTSERSRERQALVTGLVKVVDKRLGGTA
jgi:hypothetical protein